MDGFAEIPAPDSQRAAAVGERQAALQRSFQHTLRSAIGCVGVGLHSGRRVNLTLRPAEAGSGIVFRRADLNVDVPARFDLVVQTRLCTLLALPGRPDASVGTIEHLMAAVAACGIDNLVIELDGPEVPVFDGSSAPFLFLIDCAGREAQDAAAEVIEVCKPVRVEDGAAYAELRPEPGSTLPGQSPHRLALSLAIDFAAAAVGRQALSLTLDETSFRRELAACRTFAFASEIEALRAAGLARGGSLDNAVVVDGADVLNPGGLRRPDEFVRHKLLDVVGDLALCGARLHGRFVASRTGHALNNRLVRALLGDETAYRRLRPATTPWSALSFAGLAA